MPTYPNSIKETADLDYKLGIKSSLNKIASVIALAYALFKANRNHAHLEFSEEIVSNGLTKIKLKSELINEILTLFPNVNIEEINQNPLLNAQMEALQVGLQLIYKLAKISFVDGSSSTKERTGGNRYAKQLDFGTNILILDTFLSAFQQDEIACEIANWINNTPSWEENPISMGIRKLCTIFSEDVPAKLRTAEGNEIIFKQQGVYEQILDDNQVVASDAKENVGTFRVFNSIFKEGIHPFIENSNGLLFVRDGKEGTLQEYTLMVDNASSMSPKRTLVTTETIIEPPASISKPDGSDMLQVIYYGAPGTGKSHQTDKLVAEDVQNKIHQRTTFHPDSDYSSFVGCYKPSKENGELTYKFVPQAFLKAYVTAWKNLGQPYYLIIEEINRGNCAQIFGDIFQLLDRREDGFSKYHITSDTDITAYLQNEAFAKMTANDLPFIEGIDTEQILSGEIMQLPSNLHIYATMNTSDQSLFPIDSAFKRRWEWVYKPIEQPSEDDHKGWEIVTDDGFAYDWWKFLTEVNNRIFDTTQSEDKKMGYWFTKADAQKRISQKKFIGKVLFYLWNDVFKDYARTENTVFKVFKDADKKETEEYTFTDFFRLDGVTERIHRLMFTLGIKREDWQEPFNPNGESDADIMPENPNEIVTYWSDFKQRLFEGPMKDVIGNYPIPKGPRFQTSLANNAGLTNTYILATTKLKTPNEKVTICAGFNTGKFASLNAFLKEHQNEFNAKVKELSGIEPNWNENQFSTTIYVAKDGIDMDWQVNNYQALYAYFSELLKEFKPNDEVTN